VTCRSSILDGHQPTPELGGWWGAHSPDVAVSASSAARTNRTSADGEGGGHAQTDFRPSVVIMRWAVVTTRAQEGPRDDAEGKAAVIYGAGGAIGGAVARAFALEGARLFLTGRSQAPVEAVARDIEP
jgi:hypothetical protein